MEEKDDLERGNDDCGICCFLSICEFNFCGAYEGRAPTSRMHAERSELTCFTLLMSERSLGVGAMLAALNAVKVIFRTDQDVKNGSDVYSKVCAGAG